MSHNVLGPNFSGMHLEGTSLQGAPVIGPAVRMRDLSSSSTDCLGACAAKRLLFNCSSAAGRPTAPAARAIGRANIVLYLMRHACPF